MTIMVIMMSDWPLSLSFHITNLLRAASAHHWTRSLPALKASPRAVTGQGGIAVQSNRIRESACTVIGGNKTNDPSLITYGIRMVGKFNG